jgi:hypothetical protein
MRIEQADLVNGSLADKTGVLFELRSHCHTTAARDATRQRISKLLLLRRNARASAEVVTAVHGDPGLYSFQVLEQNASIHGEVTHHGKFAEWLQSDGLFEFVH